MFRRVYLDRLRSLELVPPRRLEIFLGRPITYWILLVTIIIHNYEAFSKDLGLECIDTLFLLWADPICHDSNIYCIKSLVEQDILYSKRILFI